MQNKKTAIVCDWLIDFGGAELVISHLLEIYPEAVIYTSVCFMDHPMLEGRRVHTSWIQNIPFLNRRHKLAGILRPYAFRSFDLSGYDLVICSSSAESKQVAMGKWNRKGKVKSRKGNDGQSELGALNFELGTGKPKVFVYCHTPIRYYWSHAKEYEDMMEFGWLNPFVKGVFHLVKGWMQKLDYEAAQRVDFFIANSKTTQERIKKYYDRESEVIYPGIEQSSKSYQTAESSNQKSILDYKSEGILSDSGSLITDSGLLIPDYYISVGRCIPYKRFDLLVDAFNTNGKKLILCTSTDTPLFRALKARSKSNIEWKFGISNEEKNRLIAGAKAFLFPPLEDFGLAPVEAMALGVPVIAYGKGGATETVKEGESGIFFTPQSSEALNIAIEKFETMQFDREKIREYAKRFSKEKFEENISRFIDR